MNQLRIAFIGRAGTGKTTLARHLAQRLNMPIIVEQIRTHAEIMGISNLGEIDWTTRNALQIASIATQSFHERMLCRGKGFVSDRSIYDYFFYYYHLVAKGHMNEVVMQHSYRQLANGAGNYTHLFFVPAWSPSTPPDGFRPTDPAFDRVDSRVEAGLSDIPGVIRLSFLDVTDRIEECLSHIGRTHGTPR